MKSEKKQQRKEFNAIVTPVGPKSSKAAKAARDQRLGDHFVKWGKRK